MPGSESIGMLKVVSKPTKDDGRRPNRESRRRAGEFLC
jgi:hypothetical protein